MMMTETAVRLTNPPSRVMLVLPGEELWGAEQLRADLPAAGRRVDRQQPPVARPRGRGA